MTALQAIGFAEPREARDEGRRSAGRRAGERRREQIFGVPGEENLDVVEALRRSSIKLVVTRHEQAAAFMAATHGRLTGEPGVCLATLGPGALNFTTGAAYALLGAMPMVMITGQKGILSRKQARFQIVDIVATMTPLTKMARQIVSPPRPSPPSCAKRSGSRSRSGPGPVHLELPEDIAARSSAPRSRSCRRTRSSCRSRHAAALDRAAEMILKAERPLVMLGAAAQPPAPVGRPCRISCGALQIPFFNTQMGKGVGRRRLGSLHGHRRAVRARLCPRRHRPRRPDHRDRPRHGREAAVLHGPARDRRCCMSAICPATVEEVFFPHAELVGDVGPSLAAAGRPARRQAAERRRASSRCARQFSRAIGDRAEESRFPLTPQRIVHDVRQVMPEDGIVCLDNGMYKIWFARNYRTHVANTLLLDNALATMGAGLPSAMMAAMLNPGRRVLAVCGDGGFMMNAQELETAVRLRLNLVVLILEDNAYGMIRWKQAVDGFPDFGMTFGNPDFVALRRGLRRQRQPGRDRRRAGAGARSRVRGRRRSARHRCRSIIRENMRVLVDELRNQQ